MAKSNRARSFAEILAFKPKRLRLLTRVVPRFGGVVSSDMIASIGYELLSQPEFVRAVSGADCVIDVRSRPSGRVKRGFSKPDLSALCGERYLWAGDRLGGFGRIADDAIRWLLDFQRARRVVLVCKEFAPGDCHRHQAIANRLAARGELVRHVCEDEMVLSNELQRSIDDDGDYDFYPSSDVWDETIISSIVSIP